MKKQFLQNLLNIYEKETLVSTQGMQDLSNFLQSAPVKNLKNEAEISGDNLKNLVSIMKARDDRISGTDRSYENEPTKFTNMIYSQIYDHLRLDLLKARHDHTEHSPDVAQVKDAVFDRARHQMKNDYEKRATEKTSPQALSDALAGKINALKVMVARRLDALFALGKALASGKLMENIDEKKEIKNIQDKNIPIEKFTLGDESLSIAAHTLSDGRPSIMTIPHKLNVGHDLEKGLELLREGSDSKDGRCSLELATYHAGANEDIPNSNPTAFAAAIYVKRALDQGVEAKELSEQAEVKGPKP